MRATVEIVGIGKRRTGTSKKGNAYDFVPLYFTCPAKDTEGVCAVTVNCDGDEYVRSGVTVGDVREFIMHESNYRLVLDAIL